MKQILLIAAVLVSISANSQSVKDFINQIKLDNLMTTVKELSGEKSTTVGGEQVTISHRVSSKGNDLAANYILERLKQYGGGSLEVKDIKYSSQGRNIVAIQKGTKNPEDIYLICAHYDTVTDHGADDNASGVSTVLELAKILSQHCVENTIIYAFWDQEEIGLVGAKNYAAEAKNNGDKLKAVYNIDMMAYDNNKDNIFDIDYNDNFGANGEGLKDDILKVFNSYEFNLTPKIVKDSQAASDNIAFWKQGFSTVLVGESWETKDRLPDTYYHKVGDQTDKFNESYYHELAKLAMAFFATKSVVVSINNKVTQNNEVLTAQEEGASYQWIDCGKDLPISGATGKTYTATKNGKYAVEITQSSCTVISDCYEVTTLDITDFAQAGFKIFPNPVMSKLNIKLTDFDNAVLDLVAINGKSIYKKSITKKRFSVDVSQLASGVYFAKLNVDGRLVIEKIIKE